MAKVVLQGYIIVPNEGLTLVNKALILHKELTLQESGCITFEVTEDKNDSNKYNVYEEFIDQQAFDIHQLRVKNSHWGKVTVNLQRNYRISNGEQTN
ncbi:putative quinol monooxygenase [Colwellia psychrerythraea]|uniref:Antibiotic biosynthesis monooxygenase n=1 Tax=Colwellia psychrerythraea TaxID=28229 RepID=A0A099KIH9_COLPS|nr:antibiotic biosynthesis monooxygenase [Colwellia psychrerythraea]KGJ90166.1 Antibiotic biosynthesis monooxygenase [Colwellia psychrerythraea]